MTTSDVIVRYINSPSQDIHIVGFGLGAHGAGYIGRVFRKLVQKKVGRVTALEPAVAMFDKLLPMFTVNKLDATVVDVLHTNSAPGLLVYIRTYAIVPLLLRIFT